MLGEKKALANRVSGLLQFGNKPFQGLLCESVRRSVGRECGDQFTFCVFNRHGDSGGVVDVFAPVNADAGFANGGEFLQELRHLHDGLLGVGHKRLPLNDFFDFVFRHVAQVELAGRSARQWHSHPGLHVQPNGVLGLDPIEPQNVIARANHKVAGLTNLGDQ